jgi:hypothetical protein
MDSLKIPEIKRLQAKQYGQRGEKVNHDALFKMLLKAPGVLQGFFDAFLPETGRFVDFNVLEFVDKDRVTIDGRKRTGDLLVKTRFLDKAAAFLIHLEHQAQPDPDLSWRMLEYIVLDRRDFRLPVYPIAVLSHAESGPANLTPLRLDFPNRRVLEFDFDVVDLGRMDAGHHIKMANPAALALAARMKFDARHRIRLTRDFFVSLANAPLKTNVRQLVAGFYSAYQPLNEEETLQLEKELGKVKPDAVREKAMQLTNPFIELGKRRGREEGRQEGRQEGEIELVLRQLIRRLGNLSPSEEEAIRKLELAKIEALGEALLDFSSRADLARWLRENYR